MKATLSDSPTRLTALSNERNLTMKRDRKNDGAWLRSFTTIVLGVTSLSALLICGYNQQADATVKIGMLAVTIISQLFMLLPQLRNLHSLKIEHEGSGTKFVVKTIRGESKSGKTVVGFVSNEDKSEEEKLISAELKRIIGDNYSYADCLKGLELLARHEPVVRKSWTQTLNKARLLSLVGKTAEAEELANGVLRRFHGSGKAAGKAYEVLSFVEEFREPKQEGVLYQQWLEKKKGYVVKGLEAFPQGHFLLMNGFEVSVQGNDAAEALAYLSRAASVDKESTRQNLAKNPMTHKAKDLSPELREAIRDLLEVDDRLRRLRLAGAQILLLLITVTLSLGIPAGWIKELPRAAVSIPVAAIKLPVKVASEAYSLASPGTGFELSRTGGGTGFETLKVAGTGFEGRALSLLKAGTGFDR